MAAAPPGFAEPFKVAVAPVKLVALLVVTVGVVASVVKDKTEPKEVPIPLLAIAQKKYVVPGESAVIPNEYVTVLVPAPKEASEKLLAGTRVPNESLHVPGLLVL